MRFYSPNLNRIRFIFSVLIVGTLTVGFSSCDSDSPSKSAALGEWYEESEFDGTVRGNAVLFVIDGIPYMGTGFNQPQNTTNGAFLKDFYAFSTSSKTWRRVADFGGDARSMAVAFAVNGKGYVGLGLNGVSYFNDFWEYDPKVGALGTWTKIADFPGTARFGSVAFALEGQGFVGAGYDGENYLKDLYAYDPATGSWNEKTAIGGGKRQNAFSFVIDNKAYVGGGRGSSGLLDASLFEYDAATNLWTEKNDLLDDKKDDDPNDKGYNAIAREQAVTFVLNGLGYIVGGSRNSVPDAQVWEYNPVTDTWIDKNSFEGSPRTGAVGFALEDRGYVMTGVSGSVRYEDMWSFDPLAIDEN